MVLFCRHFTRWCTTGCGRRPCGTTRSRSSLGCSPSQTSSGSSTPSTTIATLRWRSWRSIVCTCGEVSFWRFFFFHVFFILHSFHHNSDPQMEKLEEHRLHMWRSEFLWRNFFFLEPFLFFFKPSIKKKWKKVTQHQNKIVVQNTTIPIYSLETLKM